MGTGRNTKDELLMVKQGAPESLYVKVRVPGWGGKLPVRRVIFCTRSRDQGMFPNAASHVHSF